MCSAGKWAMPLSSPRWRGQHQKHVRPKSLRFRRAHAVGTRSNACGVLALRRSPQAPRMETSASTWSSKKWARSFGAQGRHLSDLESAQTRLAGCPRRAAIHPAQRGSQQATHGSLRFFQLLIAALGTLNSARPFYICLSRCGGPPEKSIRVCVKRCDANELAAAGRRRNSSCQPFHLSSTPHRCQALLLSLS